MIIFKDARVDLNIDCAQSIKSIKYLTWEKIFDKKIMELRKKEFLQLLSMKIVD